MNVIREDVDALNAILKVQVAQEDYQSKVKASLEKYRKNSTKQFLVGKKFNLDSKAKSTTVSYLHQSTMI